jgi:hypothetical protein
MKVRRDRLQDVRPVPPTHSPGVSLQRRFSSPADRLAEHPCVRSGSREQWRTPAGGWLCRSCLVQAKIPIHAVQA